VVQTPVRSLPKKQIAPSHCNHNTTTLALRNMFLAFGMQSGRHIGKARRLEI
jgi:hypothetical protein